MESIKINFMDNENKEIQQLFDNQQGLMSQIYQNGFNSIVEKAPNIREAFRLKDRCVRCMDEGTPGGLHSAGSGILRDKNEVVDSFRKAGVTKITSHDGCGAAGLYAKSKGLDVSKADEIGKEFAKEIANELGVPHEHIVAEQMNRPETHISRVAYYDGTGSFDYFPVKELPVGFIVSRGIQNPGDSLREIEIAIKIATGNHGFGSLIDNKNPFVITVIGNDEENLLKLKEELSKIKEIHGENVLIDGFIKPR